MEAHCTPREKEDVVKRRALSKTDRERTPYAEAHGGRKLGGGAPAVVLGSTADDDGDASHCFHLAGAKRPYADQ